MNPEKTIRVLYIDGVGPFGGASRSLFELLRGMPEGRLDAKFWGVKGTANDYYRRISPDMVLMPGSTKFDNTRFGHYRGVRWLILAREITYMPFTLAAGVLAKLRWRRFDLIHANEITDIFPALLARALFRAPLVLHTRALVWQESQSLRCRALNWLVTHQVDCVVAIDQNVQATLPEGARVEVIHNTFKPSGAFKPDQVLRDRIEALPKDNLRVGFVGNLQVSKGIFDLVEAARILQAEGCTVDYLIVGGDTRKVGGLRDWVLRRLGLLQDSNDEFIKTIQAECLEDRFHLLGATDEISLLYDAIDVLCFPSHFDAPGRPVLEAAFSAKPAIVATRNPRPDTLIPGETGLAVPSRDPGALAAAIRHFATDPEEPRRMGANARALVMENCVPEHNAQKLLDVYASVLETAGRRQG